MTQSFSFISILHGIKNTLEEIVIMCANGAKDKGVNFELELNFQEGYLHSFDKLRFTQVIQNLISNALKFTNEGYVKLSASNPIDASDIEIIIEDSGIGIPEDEQEKLFERKIDGIIFSLFFTKTLFLIQKFYQTLLVVVNLILKIF